MQADAGEITMAETSTTQRNHLERRDELLLKMYDQMFNQINTHILVVWQSVGVLVGAFAILALTEKQFISMNVAIAGCTQNMSG